MGCARQWFLDLRRREFQHGLPVHLASSYSGIADEITAIGWQHPDNKRLQSKAAKRKYVLLFSRHYPTELLR